ncbi:iron-containing redox enzyme family protein [Mesorhizobium sp. M0227]|uniref:iron-containing redox enzyme family protein n=1 Tax=Mesorhizobium sp. M0227 TaxID=2956922 RepID=UPI0033367E25
MDSNVSLSFPLSVDSFRKSLVLSNSQEQIKFEGIPPGIGFSIIRDINDQASPLDLAARYNVDIDIVREFLLTLSREKLVTAEKLPFFKGSQISAVLSSCYKQWNDTLFSHRLWTSLADGTARSGVVDGWLIESYHFIRGANARLSYAVSLCQDQRIKSIFAHHYSEEYDHYKFFAESLSRRKIDPLHIDELGPLPSTLAVLNMARRAARIDPLAYAACSGLLESTGSDSGRAREFYGLVEKNYDLDQSGFVEPMVRHIDLDEEFEHGDVMADVFNPIEYIEEERANTILQTVSLFRETLSMWFDEIERYYYTSPYRAGIRYRFVQTNSPRDRYVYSPS